MKKHLYLPLIACLGSLVVIPTADAGLSTQKSGNNTSGLVAAQPSHDTIRQIARSITVKVFAGDSRGSGILIAKAGQVYTVLTNAHVVNRGEPYRIQTPDGKIYQALLKNKGDSFRGNDLAVLQFQAKSNYTIATLGDSSALVQNREVFAAGFPFEQEQLTFTSGKITLISLKPLVGGYQIGYTNETEQGMSGGPVLNRDGKLVGVVGMGAQAILNDGYVYQDKTRPTESTLKQMRQASFAVPIATLAQIEPSFTAMLRDARNGESTAKTPVYTGVVGEIDKIAQQITVRIDSRNNGNGSGAIVAKQGQTYYVLTAAHVVKNEDQYQVVTPDGQQYPVSSSTVTFLEGVDLAVVQFTSTLTYPVATLANYNFRNSRTWVFVSGFPKSSASQTNQSQRMLTAGAVRNKNGIDTYVKDSFSLTDGNELLYSNFSYPGMSGGPVLDISGRVVGINTGSENEIEINKEGQPIELNLGYSLGVPIAPFVTLATKAKMQHEWLKVETSTPPVLTKAEQASINNQLFSLQVPSKDADALAWLNYGNQMWRLSSLEPALAAFDRAIQLKPDFYQAYYAKGLVLLEQEINPEALVAFEQATKLAPNFYPAWRWRGYTFLYLEKYPEALASFEQAIKIKPKDFDSHQMRGSMLGELKRYSDALAAYDEAIKIKSNSQVYTNRALIFFDLKEYQKAIADCNKAIDLDPDNAIAYSNRGNVYYQLKKYQKAIADHTKAIDIKPDSADAYNGRGIAYAELKEYQKALADYNIAIQLQPNDTDAYNNRGLTYYELKDYQKAIADLTKAIQLKPDYADAYNNRGLTYADLKEYQKAIADYNKAIKLQPDYADAYVSRGIAYDKLEDYQKAIADYTKGMEFQPDDAKAYNNRGGSYAALKEYQKSLADFTKAIELQPDYALAYNNRGGSYAALKEYQKAIADYTKAIKLQPDLADVYYNRGITYVYLKEYQKAIADYNKAIELQPDNANAYNNRGGSYAALKEYQKAIADFTKAIKLQPDNANAYNSRGLTYTNLKEYLQAIADFTKTIELQPDYALAYYERGNAYSELEEYLQAIADYTKTIELQPDYALAYYERGNAYSEFKKYQKAIVDYTKAIKLQPDYALAYYNRGVTYWKLKDYQKALLDFNKIIKLQPDYALAYYARGVTYAKLEDYQKAIAEIQKAAQLFYQQGDMEEYKLAQDILRKLQSNK